MTVTVNPTLRLVLTWPPGLPYTTHYLSRRGIDRLLIFLFDEAQLVRAWNGLEYVFRVEVDHATD